MPGSTRIHRVRHRFAWGFEFHTTGILHGLSGVWERARLRKLVNTALSVSADADNHEKVLEDDAAREAEYIEALKALRIWYVEWADIARVEIKRRDRLIRLGLAARKRPKDDDRDRR